MPVSWSQVLPKDLKNIKGVCLDIDETLSTKGKLTPEAFSSLWALKKKGFKVVPLTGRPAGWCDHIARFWPVDAVIGENGAFSFFMQHGVRRRLETKGVDFDSKIKLQNLSKKILEHFPHAKWASDQAYREFDLAIDICEDVSPWQKKDIQGLIAMCENSGAHAKLSSIHVNTWFGDYDKLKGFQNWLSCEPPATSFEDWIFIGDSPNDEPLFSTFKYSVGVYNLSIYLKDLKHPPRWITQKESGAGFTEMVEKLISDTASQSG